LLSQLSVNRLNIGHARHTVFPVAMGIELPWKLCAEHHSPCYTTRLNDVPIARA